MFELASQHQYETRLSKIFLQLTLFHNEFVHHSFHLSAIIYATTQNEQGTTISVAHKMSGAAAVLVLHVSGRQHIRQLIR